MLFYFQSIFLGGSCCSVNVICAFWHLQERKFQNAVRACIREKYDQENPEPKNQNIIPNGLIANKNIVSFNSPRHDYYNKHTISRDFVRERDENGILQNLYNIAV